MKASHIVNSLVIPSSCVLYNHALEHFFHHHKTHIDGREDAKTNDRNNKT
jgi:hypothetical protein